MEHYVIQCNVEIGLLKTFLGIYLILSCSCNKTVKEHRERAQWRKQSESRIFKFSSRFGISIFHVFALFVCHKFICCPRHLKYWHIMMILDQFSPDIKLKWDFNILICHKEQDPFNCTTPYIRLSKSFDRSQDSSVGIVTGMHAHAHMHQCMANSFTSNTCKLQNLVDQNYNSISIEKQNLHFTIQEYMVYFYIHQHNNFL
jgi:hypothetical protein